jgi:uncharacterized membrane protein HdeD (DUF308 family)
VAARNAGAQFRWRLSPNRSGAESARSRIVCEYLAPRPTTGPRDARFPHGVSTLTDSPTATVPPQSTRQLKWRSAMDSVIERAGKMARTQVTKLRWALGINGVLSIAFGAVILIWPGISLFALTILFGAYATATGIIGLGAAISGTVKEGRGWLVVSSLLGITVGLVALIWTGISALALLYVIGAYAIAFGIIMIGGAFYLPIDGTDSALFVLGGLVSILFGIVMFARPGDGALVLLALIAAFALVSGISSLVAAIGGERLLERGARRFVAGWKPQMHS